MQPELRSFPSVSTTAPVTMLKKPGSPAGRAARLQLPGMSPRKGYVSEPFAPEPPPGPATCQRYETAVEWHLHGQGGGHETPLGTKVSPRSRYGSCHWNFDEHSDPNGQRLSCTEDEAIVWISSPSRPPPLVFLSHHQPLILISVVDVLFVNSVVPFLSTLLWLLDLPAGRAFILFLAS